MHMNPKKLLALLGLKYDPFLNDVPPEALCTRAALDHFLWRSENLVMDGGIATITGEPGLGKSSTLRLLNERLRGIREIEVVRIDRPQSGVTDFYRELGDLFNVGLKVSNRYGSFQTLRSKWRNHINSTLLRPVILIDEAQYAQDAVLSELRLLLSDQFDSRRILAVFLSGDNRLHERMKGGDLLPLASRVRIKLALTSLDEDEMQKMLEHAITQAGNSRLMTPGVMATIIAHSGGNPRTMMNTAHELLSFAVSQEKNTIDEKLYMEVYQPQQRPKQGKQARQPT